MLHYLALSLLFEGSGDERRVSLDDSHILYLPAFWQLGVRWDLDQLQAHLLPQRSSQATKLTLSFGQVHRNLPVLLAVPCFLSKGLWNAPHHGVGEMAIRAHVCHGFNNVVANIGAVPKISLSWLCQERNKRQ